MDRSKGNTAVRPRPKFGTAPDVGSYSDAPKLEGKLLRVLHAWPNVYREGIVYQAWRLSGFAVQRPRDPGVVNLRQLEQNMRKECLDADAWFAASDD
jgi:hypothetical protein